MKPESSSSDKPASSSSSAKPNSSSSDKPASSSSGKPDAILAGTEVPRFNVEMAGRNLQISGARIDSRYAIMDMQGRVLNTGRVGTTNFSVNMPCAGSYMVRIGNQIQHVNVK